MYKGGFAGNAILTYRYRYTPTVRERHLLRAGYSTATYDRGCPEGGSYRHPHRERPHCLRATRSAAPAGPIIRLRPRLLGGEAAHASPDPGSAAVKARSIGAGARLLVERAVSWSSAPRTPLPAPAVACAEPAGLDGRPGPAAASTPARSASPRPSPDVRVTPLGGAAGAAGGCPAAGLPGTALARQPPWHPPRRPRARAPNPHRSVGGPPRSTYLSLCWPFRLRHFPQSRLATAPGFRKARTRRSRIHVGLGPVDPRDNAVSDQQINDGRKSVVEDDP